MESGKRVLSHESIYRFIYGQMARKKDYGWRHYLHKWASRGVVGEAVEGAVLPPSWLCDAPLVNAPGTLLIAALLGTGRRT